MNDYYKKEINILFFDVVIGKLCQKVRRMGSLGGFPYENPHQNSEVTNPPISPILCYTHRHELTAASSDGVWNVPVQRGMSNNNLSV